MPEPKLQEKALWEKLDLKSHNFIEASAGTGKTYTLEHFIFRILSEPGLGPGNSYVGLDNIVVLTYTEKAAGEIRERVRNLIYKKWLELSQQIGDSDLLGQLEKNLNGFDNACIFTIHGWCKYLLNRYAFELGQNLSSELVDNSTSYLEALLRAKREKWPSFNAERLKRILKFTQDTQYNQKDLLESILSQFNYQGPLGNNNIDEIEPFLSLKNHSGEKGEKNYQKTRTQLLGFLSDVNNALSQATGKNKTEAKDFKRSNECLDQIRVALLELEKWTEGFQLDDVYDFMSRHPLLQKNLLADRAPTLRLAKPLRDKYPELHQQVEKLGIELIKTLQPWVEIIQKLGSISPQVWRDIQEMLEYAFEEGEKKKRGKGEMSFDDMILNVLKACENKESDFVNLIRDQYQYAIVDEFQDTNLLQWSIFKKIFLDATKENGNGPRLCLVGDPKQSIYAFQGADVSSYLLARKKLLDCGGKLESLDKNYRSSPELIEAFNEIFSYPQWFSRSEQTKDNSIYYKEAICGKTESKQAIKLLDKGPFKKHTYPVHLNDLTHLEGADLLKRSQASWLASQIEELVPKNKENIFINIVQNQLERPLMYRDICVLVQKHSEGEYLKELLAQKGIPFLIYKENGLFQSNSCIQLCSMLEALFERGWGPKSKRTLLGDFFHFSGNLFNGSLDVSDYPVIKSKFEKWKEFAALKKWQKLFSSLMEDSGILYRQILYPDGNKRISAYRQIIQYLLEFVAYEAEGLEDFIVVLRRLIRQEVSPEGEGQLFKKESDEDAVRIMTIHASKGLQFPVVMLMAGTHYYQNSEPYIVRRKEEGGRIYNLALKSPSANQDKEKARQQAEEEFSRLYYVALTRAQFRLYLPLYGWEAKEGVKAPKNAHCAKLFFSPALHKAAKEKPDLFYIHNPEAEPEKELGNVSHTENPVSQNLQKGISIAEQIPFPLENPEYAEKLLDVLRYQSQSSYSSLARHISGETSIEGRQIKDEVDDRVPGEELENVTGPIEVQNTLDSSSMESLPKGKNSGNMLHQLMEEIPLSHWQGFSSLAEANRDKLLSEALDNALAKYGLSNKYKASAMDILWRSAKSNIQISYKERGSFQLCQITQAIPEMEFHISMGPDNEPFYKGSESNYLLGYMDLVFKLDQQYYVLDWKSNSLDSYGPLALARSMEESQYNLQAMIYALALHGWLKSKIPNYDPHKHFGGVFYIYMRGMDDKGNGCYFQKPSLEDLEQHYPKLLKDIFSQRSKPFQEVILK